MKIILLSDLHLMPKEELARNDFDINHQFKKIIDRLKKEDYDSLIILGDICCKDPDLAIYHWFFEELEKLNKPFELITGNHDDSELMIKKYHFHTADTGNKLLYYSKNLGTKTCLFLDTSEGIIKDQQKQWLKEQLAINKNDLFIFMHHPPCYAGVPFMDNKYPLKDQEEILSLFQSQDYRIDVFTGHYHVDKDLQFDNCHIHICPSPYFILDQSTDEFKIKQQVPCFKVLEVGDKEFKIDSVYLK